MTEWIEHKPGVNTPPVGSLVCAVCSGTQGELPPQIGRVSPLGRAIGSWAQKDDFGVFMRVVRFAYLYKEPLEKVYNVDRPTDCPENEELT